MPHREITVTKTVRYTAAMWCDGEPVILCGLEELPRAGFRFEVDGEEREVVSDRWSFVCEFVPATWTPSHPPGGPPPASRCSRRRWQRAAAGRR